MEERIRQHKLYLDTVGKSGVQMNLCGDDLSNMDLPDQDFTESVFTEVNFGGANLRNCQFDGCLGLWGSIFDGADMSFVTMRKANADEASFRNTILVNSNLRRSTFFDAIFAGAKLENSDLSKARFVNCDLRYSNLSNADLAGATIDRCKVNGILLQGAKNVDSVHTRWIDIGANDIPLILTGDQAKEWLIRQAEE